MADIAWALQGTTPTTIDETDILQFAGAAFNDPVFVSSWQDTTHVKTSIGGNKSSANTPNNVKFISQAGGTGGDSQADWGDGTEDLDAITDAEATLHIEVSDAGNITVTDIVFFSYDPGATPADPLANLSVKAAQVGDTNWTDAEGSASPLVIDDSSTPATTHDFYIAISKSPGAIGLLEDTLRFEGVIGA